MFVSEQFSYQVILKNDNLNIFNTNEIIEEIIKYILIFNESSLIEICF